MVGFADDALGDPDGDCIDSDDEHLYYTQDANFNTTALVDASDGSVVERYVYDPYGTVAIWNEARTSTIAWANSKQNEILFCGYRFDPESGLYHVRHRMYHPTLGRWLGRDPLGYVDGTSLYEYCGDSPASVTDPLGLRSEASEHEIYYFTLCPTTEKHCPVVSQELYCPNWVVTDGLSSVRDVDSLDAVPGPYVPWEARLPHVYYCAAGGSDVAVPIQGSLEMARLMSQYEAALAAGELFKATELATKIAALVGVLAGSAEVGNQIRRELDDEIQRQFRKDRGPKRPPPRIRRGPGKHGQPQSKPKYKQPPPRTPQKDPLPRQHPPRPDPKQPNPPGPENPDPTGDDPIPTSPSVPLHRKIIAAALKLLLGS